MDKLRDSFGHRFDEELPAWLLVLYKWKWIEPFSFHWDYKKISKKNGIEPKKYAFLDERIKVIDLSDPIHPKGFLSHEYDLEIRFSSYAPRGAIVFRFQRYGTLPCSRTPMSYAGVGKSTTDPDIICSQFREEISRLREKFGNQRFDREIPSWFKKLYTWNFSRTNNLSQRSIKKTLRG